MLRNFSISFLYLAVACMFFVVPAVDAQHAQGQPQMGTPPPAAAPPPPPTTTHQQQGSEAQYQQMIQQQTQEVDVSEKEVAQAAEAFVEIEKIKINLQQSLSDVQEAEMAQQLQAQASHQMAMAVQNAGLAVPKYNQIMQAAQFDEDLRNRFIQAVNAIQGS